MNIKNKSHFKISRSLINVVEIDPLNEIVRGRDGKVIGMVKAESKLLKYNLILNYRIPTDLPSATLFLDKESLKLKFQFKGLHYPSEEYNDSISHLRGLISTHVIKRLKSKVKGSPLIKSPVKSELDEYYITESLRAYPKDDYEIHYLNHPSEFLERNRGYLHYNSYVICRDMDSDRSHMADCLEYLKRLVDSVNEDIIIKYLKLN